MIKDIFEKSTVDVLVERLNKLSPEIQPKWGKMSASQILAHCNVTYEMIYESKHPKPNFFARTLLKAFVKNGVVNDVPYKHNSRTAPAFIISDKRAFEEEKQRLISYLSKTQQLGAKHFDGKESLSFGKLNKEEWSNMMYKHLDHHLQQLGV